MGYKMWNIALWLGAVILGSTLVDFDHFTGTRTLLHYEAGMWLGLGVILIGLALASPSRHK